MSSNECGVDPFPAIIDGHDIDVDPSFEAWDHDIDGDGPEVELAIVFPAEVYVSSEPMSERRWHAGTDTGHRTLIRQEWTATLQNNGDWTYEVAPSVEVQDYLEKNKAHFMRLPRV